MKFTKTKWEENGVELQCIDFEVHGIYTCNQWSADDSILQTWREDKPINQKASLNN
jgi:hypothetical protein